MRKPIPTWFFALAVVRRGDEFLLVQESSELWYLPAGRVEPGETVAEAAVRETLEESGVPVVLEGVLRLEHTPTAETARLRVIFLARPAGQGTPAKTTADEHSLRAEWVRLADLERYPLRGMEVRRLLEEVAAGTVVLPMEQVGQEG